MNDTLVRCPYPWPRDEARELHMLLCELYPTAKGALWIAAASGVPTFLIDGEQAPFFVWQEILNEGARQGSLRALANVVVEQKPRNPRIGLIETLIRGDEPTLDRQPHDSGGVPHFLSASDQVTEAEALLFHDDLTIEFGRLSWLAEVLGRLRTLGSGVCKLTTHVGSAKQYGTGFRIGANALLTNWHVVHFLDADATIGTAEFGFEDDGKGGGAASRAYPCDMASVVSNEADDWAVIRVATPLPRNIPILSLAGAADPVVGDPAFIIQHPNGERKRVAYTRNQITTFDARAVHYLSDTQSGSSGSPVLDADGRLIGLHRAGGRPQEVAGQMPLRKNEGVRIPCILAGLDAQHIVVG
ncbi:MAG: serine protease [Pseudomonadota bacterium]